MPEMERRHFEIVAHIINEWRTDVRNVDGLTVNDAADALVDRFTDELARTNPHFDRAKFIRAATYD